MSYSMPLSGRQILGFSLGVSAGLFLFPMSMAWADDFAQAVLGVGQQGNQVSVNGKTVAGDWALWPNAQTGQTEIGLSDSLWMRHLGGDLLDSVSSMQQPVQWFSAVPKQLPTRLSARGNARYLTITEAARQWGWRVQANGAVLDIQTPSAVVQSVRLGQQVWGRRLVLALDRPAPWRITSLTNSRTGRTDRQFTVQIDASLASTALQGFTSIAGMGLKALSVTSGQNRATLRGVIDGRFQPQVWTLDNPPRLVLDVRQTPMKSRQILWAPGVEWREDLVSLGQAQFPVTWLALNPRQPGLRLLPIWGSASGVVGIDPLTRIAQQNHAAAVINAGFFSRDRQTPLGAIRRDGVWVSSPILNRGVMAWDAQGRFRVGRLMLQEQLLTGSGGAIAIVSSNSGYPQKGIARYTAAWGSTYTPLLQNEQIITVVNNQVQTVQPAKEGMTFPIPGNGAVLVARAVAVGAELAPGTSVQHRVQALRPEFEAFPHIMGAGPVLLENGQHSANVIAEQFSPTFAIQAADRSAIGQTANGIVLLAVTHNRIGGSGPTLSEWAQIMARLGAVNALNLDGGSSTALYLGGQLLDRHPTTAARVQNGIGVFLQPTPQAKVGSATIEQKSLR